MGHNASNNESDIRTHLRHTYNSKECKCNDCKNTLSTENNSSIHIHSKHDNIYKNNCDPGDMIHKSSTIKTMSEHKEFDHQTSSEDVENLSVLNVETSEESNINEAQPSYLSF